MKPLQQVAFNHNIKSLEPAYDLMTFDLHFNHIYKKHVDDFNDEVGDLAFNKAGAELHSSYFENVREFRAFNRPIGKSAHVIEMRYGSWENFVLTCHDQASRLQGNGWVYMNNAGYVNIIPNNRIVKGVAMIIDLWEHAFVPMFGNDRSQYLTQQLGLIDWDIVNKRILKEKKE